MPKPKYDYAEARQHYAPKINHQAYPKQEMKYQYPDNVPVSKYDPSRQKQRQDDYMKQKQIMNSEEAQYLEMVRKREAQLQALKPKHHEAYNRDNKPNYNAVRQKDLNPIAQAKPKPVQELTEVQKEFIRVKNLAAANRANVKRENNIFLI